MSRQYDFLQVDVFTRKPYCGNPLAVVLGATELATDEMQKIAAWTNLSETVFLSQPVAGDADYRVRIFDPHSELPFAGHPTIGSAYAALRSGLVARGSATLVQECGAGLLKLQVEEKDEEQRIYTEVPEPSIRSIDPVYADDLHGALHAPAAGGPPPMIIDVGPRWLVARIASAQLVHALAPEMSGIDSLCRELGIIGTTVFAFTEQPGASVYARSFAPTIGIDEDPVCGSGNAAVAAWLIETGLIDEVGREFTAAQGHELGRDGLVYVRSSGNRDIRIGGTTVTCIEGKISIPADGGVAR